MKVIITERGALYCDTGPNQGMYRVDIAGNVYMTPEEFDRYNDAVGLDVVIKDRSKEASDEREDG